MKGLRSIWLGAMALTLGCDAPLGISDNDLPLLRVEMASVIATGDAFTVRYSLTNLGDQPIYVRTQPCSVGLERREGSRWMRAWEQTECLTYLQVPIPLAPAEVLDASVVVHYPVYATAGQHRVLMHAVSDRLHSNGLGMGPNLPLEYRVSNAFSIEVR